MSLTGIQIEFTYTGECPEHGCRNSKLDMELYSDSKVMTIGPSGYGDPNKDCTEAFHKLVYDDFPETAAGGTANPDNRTNGPVEGSRPIEDDEELIRRARKSQSGNVAFGQTASFEALFTADEEELRKAYPGNPYDESRADAGLAQRLAWWTGKDCERMERLMRRSALERPKWDTMRGSITWIQQTILRAVSMQTKLYGEQTVHTPGTVINPDGIHGVETPQKRGGNAFMTIEDQLKHFEGCIYIESEHAVLCTGWGHTQARQFSARYGGYHFNMDTDQV